MFILRTLKGKGDPKVKIIYTTIVSVMILHAISIAAEKIVVKGSDTMVILAERWAKTYMTMFPKTTIQATGGGSGIGINSLINGTTDICFTSRRMKIEEKERLKHEYNTLGVEIKVARDGVSIYVNESNPLNEISKDQLIAIFTGKIKNWKEVGGLDYPINLYCMENTSGASVYFKELVLQDDNYSPSAKQVSGPTAMVNAVMKDRFGIGYNGVTYIKGVKVLKVKYNELFSAFAPTKENISSNTYPLSHYLYLYLRNQPSGTTKDFIDWILSSEGQKIAAAAGFFPVR